MDEFPNWFEQGGAEQYFARHLGPFRGTPVQALQVGAYTGDATAWMLEHVLTDADAVLTDVDPWLGSDETEHHGLDWAGVEQFYDRRHADAIASGRLRKLRMTSDAFFATYPDRTFDFIYIDGDHKAASVLVDGVHAIPRLNPGGIIGFDDYAWRSGRGPAFDPYPAIDALRICYSDVLEVIDTGLQVWMRRRP